MKEEDKKLIDSVANALFQVRNANVLKTSNSVALGDEQTVEASVILTRDAIRENTGRLKVRDVVVDDIESELQQRHGLEVTRTANDDLMVKTVPLHRESEFPTLDHLLVGATRAKKYVADHNDEDDE